MAVTTKMAEVVRVTWKFFRELYNDQNGQRTAMNVEVATVTVNDLKKALKILIIAAGGIIPDKLSGICTKCLQRHNVPKPGRRPTL